MNGKPLFAAIMVMVAVHCRAGDEGPHQAWDQDLRKHVDDAGQVDYNDWLKDTAALDTYLRWLARTDASALSSNGQLAYWINAYNAFTVKLILDHYPVKSIKDIPKRWEAEAWEAGGKRYSLNQIEHEILRSDFQEPRIHFAIVCASIGCPDLWNRAFTEDGVDQQLQDASTRFFQSPKHIRFEKKKGAFGKETETLYLSSILKWFEEDFTENGKAPIERFVTRFAPRPMVKQIFQAGDALKIKHLDYDWDLNKQP